VLRYQRQVNAHFGFVPGDSDCSTRRPRVPHDPTWSQTLAYRRLPKANVALLTHNGLQHCKPRSMTSALTRADRRTSMTRKIGKKRSRLMLAGAVLTACLAVSAQPATAFGRLGVFHVLGGGAHLRALAGPHVGGLLRSGGAWSGFRASGRDAFSGFQAFQGARPARFSGAFRGRNDGFNGGFPTLRGNRGQAYGGHGNRRNWGGYYSALSTGVTIGAGAASVPSGSAPVSIDGNAYHSNGGYDPQPAGQYMIVLPPQGAVTGAPKRRVRYRR